jgi:hypothetical protein
MTIPIVCLLVAFITLITPNYISPNYLTVKNKQIVGIIALLVAYYYFNNEKMF